MRWVVPVLCTVAALTALLLGPRQGGDPPGGGDAAPAATAPTAADGRTPGDAPSGEIGELWARATEATPLPDDDLAVILDACLHVDPEADPTLSPDPAAVRIVASGGALDAAAVVWTGPTPQYDRALGSCVALQRSDGWQLVGRAVRRDLGPRRATLAWHPAASDDDAAAVLAGRVPGDAAVLLVVLEDGRALRQEVTAGVAALPWQPVEEPVRLVVLGADDAVRYDGPLIGYAP